MTTERAVAHYEEPAGLPAVQSETAAVLSMFERLARDPTINPERIGQLMDLQERAALRHAKQAFAEALTALQQELPAISRRGQIKHGENKPVLARYALWEDIVDAITPVLGRHGFALTFRIGHEADRLLVTGVLTHRGGHSEETTMRLPVDSSGAKNAVQALGSSTSYGKRYVAGALLNLTSRGEDDDGRAGGGAGPAPTITDEQAETIRGLVKKAGADIGKFLEYFRAESIPDLLAKDFNEATAMLRRKQAEAKAAQPEVDRRG